MATYDLGKVVGDAGAKGDNGSTVWNTSTAPTYANSKYTFTISNLSGKTGLEIAVNDIIFYSTYYYIVSTVNSTTVDCTTRVSIKGSDASVTIVDNLTSTSSTSALSAKQGKVLNDNKVETSAIATSWGGTLSDSKVPSEKLAKNSLDAKQATLVSGTNIKTINNNSILGSGNIDISSVDIATSWGSTLSDTKVPSEKLTKNSLDDKITKSSTSGLVKNDGTIDTNSYLTSSSLSNYVQKSSTTGLLKNDGTIDETSYLPASSYTPYYYTTCSTGASTQVKEVSITDFTLATGVVVVVKFTNGNSYNGTAQLKINTSTAIDIATVGTTKTSRYHWTAGEVITFVYDGTNFVMDSEGTATTTYYGVTKLSSSTSSTSEALAATPKAVKAAYDLADGKLGSSDVGAAALSNSYNDLDNKPTIPSSSSDLSDGSDLVKTSSTAGLIKNDGTIDTTSYSTFSGSYNDLSNKPTIPSKISDLTNDSNFIETSSTSGLIKNDGTIDTSSYITSSALSNYMQKSSTAGLMKNDGTVDTNTYLTSSSLSNYIQKSNTSGLIKNDGTIDTSTYLTQMKIGSTSGLPVKTGSSGVLTTGSFGTTSGTFAEGNHTHGNINNNGSLSDGDYKSVSNFTGNEYVMITDGDDSWKIKRALGILASMVIDYGHTFTNISPATKSQTDINTAIDTAIGGKVTGTKVTSWSSTVSDSNVPSEKLVKNSLPTKVSDLSNDSGFITSSAITGMLTSSDIVDNLTTNDATKVLSAKQGKALKDLIGDAITYINQ